MQGLFNDIEDWFKSLPIFTRYWFGGSVLLTLLGRFRLVNTYWFILTWDTFISKFHIWRPVTALFYYPIGFHFLINLYYLYRYSLALEKGVFDGRPADYLFMLIFNWLLSVIVALFLQMSVLMDLMVMSVLYVWCQINKDAIVYFWFGIRLKAMYLPWVLFGFNLILAIDWVDELCGILIGHIYFFLMFKYPQDFGGPSLLSTPDILYSWFPSRWGRGVPGYGQAPQRGGGGSWGGRGHRPGSRPRQ